MNRELAVYPGSFDPITLGHYDIIQRAAAMFGHLLVVVMVNPDKHCLFSPQERVELIRKTVCELPNVSVEFSDGLLAEYVRKKQAKTIIKGLRAVSDFEYEFQMALTNKKLNPDAETVFLMTRAENMYLSSSLVRQIAAMGGDISEFVPSVIHGDVVNRLQKN